MKLRHLLFIEKSATTIRAKYTILNDMRTLAFYAIDKLPGGEYKERLHSQLRDVLTRIVFDVSRKVALIETIIFRNYSLEQEDSKKFIEDLLNDLSQLQTELNTIKEQIR